MWPRPRLNLDEADAALFSFSKLLQERAKCLERGFSVNEVLCCPLNVRCKMVCQEPCKHAFKKRLAKNTKPIVAKRSHYSGNRGQNT